MIQKRGVNPSMGKKSELVSQMTKILRKEATNAQSSPNAKRAKIAPVINKLFPIPI